MHNRLRIARPAQKWHKLNIRLESGPHHSEYTRNKLDSTRSGPEYTHTHTHTQSLHSEWLQNPLSSLCREGRESAFFTRHGTALRNESGCIIQNGLDTNGQTSEWSQEWVPNRSRTHSESSRTSTTDSNRGLTHKYHSTTDSSGDRTEGRALYQEWISHGLRADQSP
jgi:hypothetical protein